MPEFYYYVSLLKSILKKFTLPSGKNGIFKSSFHSKILASDILYRVTLSILLKLYIFTLIIIDYMNKQFSQKFQ